MTILDDFNSQKLKAHKELLKEIHGDNIPVKKLESLENEIKKEKKRRNTFKNN